jgi:hypothetical protein
LYFFAGGKRLHGGASTRVEATPGQLGGEFSMWGKAVLKAERGRGEDDQHTGGPRIWQRGTTDMCCMLIRRAQKYL